MSCAAVNLLRKLRGAGRWRYDGDSVLGGVLAGRAKRRAIRTRRQTLCRSGLPSVGLGRVPPPRQRRYDLGMLTISVEYLSWPGYGEYEEPVRVDLEGEAHESFAEVLTARLYPDSDYAGHVEVELPDVEVGTFAPIHEDVTMQQAHAFAGGEVLTISRAGRGGGLIATLAEWVGVGLTLSGVWDLLRRGGDSYVNAVYRRQRQEARRWLVAGTDTDPHLDLIQWVKEHPGWSLGDVEVAFGLGVADAAALLR